MDQSLRDEQDRFNRLYNEWNQLSKQLIPKDRVPSQLPQPLINALKEYQSEFRGPGDFDIDLLLQPPTMSHIKEMMEDPFAENPFEVADESMNVFADDNVVDESWLESQLVENPFDSTNYQSSVLNPALLLDFEDDDDRLFGAKPSQRPNTILDNLQSTWSQSVDAQLLQRISMDERKRQESIFELISTESNYVHKLQTLIDVFYIPLRSRPSLMSPSELSAIFINIESLLVCNVKILSDLEDLQRKDRLLVQSIGNVFLKHLNVVKVPPSRDDDVSTSLLAYVEYCGNQMSAIKTLQSARKRNHMLNEFLDKCKRLPQCKGLDLSAFLLEPMQRITRYPLLLKQVIHYTSKDHRDQPALLECMKITERLLGKVNTAARDADSRLRLFDLNSLIYWHPIRLDLTSPTRILGQRILLHDGTIYKAKSGRKLHMFLFNDMILFTTPTKDQGKKFKLYKTPFPIDEVYIKQGGSNDLKNAAYFGIGCGSELMILKAPDEKSKTVWIQRIEDAMKQMHNAAHSNNQKLILEQGEECIGTLKILIIGAIKLKVPQLQTHSNTNTLVYCSAQVNKQIGQTSLLALSEDCIVRWSQPLLFSIRSLDDRVTFHINVGDKYSRDQLVGSCSIQLDFLEYYSGKDTEKIQLNVTAANGTETVDVGRLFIRMNYKSHM